MSYLELSERDRKRYGVPERVEFEAGQIGMRAIKALRVQTGYDYDRLKELAGGVPKLDEHGDAITEPELDDNGEPVLNEDGTPRRKLVLFHDEDALVAMVWVILWDAGHRIPWDTFDVYPVGLRLIIASDESPGKATTD